MSQDSQSQFLRLGTPIIQGVQIYLEHNPFVSLVSPLAVVINSAYNYFIPGNASERFCFLLPRLLILF